MAYLWSIEFDMQIARGVIKYTHRMKIKVVFLLYYMKNIIPKLPKKCFQKLSKSSKNLYT